VRCGLEERSCADAARELDLSEGAVIKRWQRLRTRLRGEAWVGAILAP
jgi:DNA-directed RNA polymerase specialized sigma24 family protein